MEEVEAVVHNPCGGPVYMHACPTHHWTVEMECQRCGHRSQVTPTCKECDWSPFALAEKP